MDQCPQREWFTLFRVCPFHQRHNLASKVTCASNFRHYRSNSFTSCSGLIVRSLLSLTHLRVVNVSLNNYYIRQFLTVDAQRLRLANSLGDRRDSNPQGRFASLLSCVAKRGNCHPPRMERTQPWFHSLRLPRISHSNVVSQTI